MSPFRIEHFDVVPAIQQRATHHQETERNLMTHSEPRSEC